MEQGTEGDVLPHDRVGLAPTGGRCRVVLLHNFPTPYRLPLFQELGSRYDLAVWYVAGADPARKWKFDPAGRGFCSKTLRSWRAGSFRVPLGLRALVRSSDVDAFVVADSIETNLSLLIVWFLNRRLGVPVIVWTEQTPAPKSVRPAIRANMTFGAYWRWWVAECCMLAVRRLIYPRVTAVVALCGDVGVQKLALDGIEPHATYVGRQVMPALAGVHSQSFLDGADTGPRDHTNLLFLGYFRPEKGIDLLIDAFKALEPGTCSLYLAGTGPGEDAARARAEGAEGIHFLGYVATIDEKAALFHKCDWLVLPSLYEPWGLVVNEAMFFGTPAIVSSVCGSRGIAERGGGMVVEAGDLASLTRTLRAACSRDVKARAKRTLIEFDRSELVDTSVGVAALEEALADAIGAGGRRDRGCGASKHRA